MQFLKKLYVFAIRSIVMDPLIILALSTAVFVVVFSVQSLIKHMRNAPENMMWFHQHRIRVNATVTHVQAGRGWKDEEGCYRDPWDGCMKQNKIWQTYYDVTAQWKDRQTQQMYTFYSKAW